MNRWFILAVCGMVALGASIAHAAEDMALFEKKAQMSKELGATFVSVSDDVPPGLWQFVPKDDPYPGWFVYRPNMLKVFPPKDLQPFVNMPYAERVAKLLEERCKILRKYGLKASFTSNEPQTLPEAFFVAYPELRGARVDQPNRSRVAWWAPSVDEPKMLELYAESIKLMLARCPEIESFTFPTSDAGGGFDWVPALYAGLNGNSKWKDRPMEQRISGFLINLQKAAKEAGHDITIGVNPIGARQWMTPSFSPEMLNSIVKALPRGLAVSGREGPDGRAFGGAGGGGGGGGAFSPVEGIVVPAMSMGGGGRGGARGGRGARGAADGEAAAAPASYSPRITVNLGDENVIDFNYRMLKATRGQRGGNIIQRMQSLREFAVTEVGEENADALLDVWSSLSQVEENLNALNFGGMLRFGHVLNRWVTRPMVPFPAELTDAEKKNWKPFLFQAKGDEQAYNLIDIQAMRMFEGWGAKMLFQRVIETTAPQVLTASQRVARFAPSIKDEKIRRFWELYAIRLEAAYCLLESSDHMVSYQAHLDRVHALGIKPEVNPPLGAQSDWARTDMMELARKEIDTMIRLRQIIMSTKEPILETADSADEETVMRLGPGIASQIKDKIDTMNRKWRDYDRIFTVPNP